MKKKNKIYDFPQNSGGLLIGETVSLDVPKKKRSYERLKLWAIALVGIFGTVFGIITLYDVECDETRVVMWTLFSFLISSVVFSAKKYAVPTFFIIALMAWGFLSLPEYELSMGLRSFVNCIVKEASLREYDITGFYVPRKVDEYECVTMFMSAFSVLTAFLVSFAVLAKKNFPLSFIFTFPLIEVGLFFGISPDYKYFAMLLAFWLAIVVLNNSNYCEYVGDNNSDFVRKGNSFMPKFGMRRKVDCSSAMCMLAITFALFSASGFVMNAFDIERPEAVNELRYNIKHGISDMSLEDVVDKLSGKDTETNYGNLGNAGNLEYDDEDMLYLTFSDDMNQSFYLKGYIGSVYDSQSWDELDRQTLKELEDIETVCEPQNMLWYFVESNYDLPQANVTVDVINAQTDFCYTPYGCNFKSSSEYVDDTVVLVDSIVVGDTDAKASYNFSYTPIHFETLLAWKCNRQANTDTVYLENGEYDEFVTDNYLQLPDNDELLSLYEEEILTDIINRYQNGDCDIYTTLCEIRSYIHDSAKYTLSPGKTPDNADFVYYFLRENHEGYCVHYASAGVILSRMAGIPARYCTGFVADKSNFNIKNKQSNGSYAFMLKDNAAHAWAEIYVEGAGWIPFEFTEGYSSDSRSTSTTTSTTTTRITTTSTKGETSAKTSKKTTSASKITTTSTAPKSAYSQSDSGKRADKTLLMIFAIIIAVAVLFTVIIMRSRKVADLRRNKNMSTKSLENNAIFAYRYLVSLLEFDGVSHKNLTPLEYAEFAEAERDYIEKGQLVNACATAMKAFFGKQSVAFEESDNLCLLAKKTAISVYNSKSFTEKLRMKYIERLI